MKVVFSPSDEEWRAVTFFEGNLGAMRDRAVRARGDFEAAIEGVEEAVADGFGKQDTEDQDDDQDTSTEQAVIDEDVEGTGTDTIEFELGSRDEANQFRDKLPDGSTTDKYDRRHKTVKVLEGALSESQLNDLTQAQAEAEAEEAEKFGQSDLTEHEKDQLLTRSDFSTGQWFHARSAKAILQGKGVDDWLSFYDPELSTDEHRELAERAKQEEGGQRMDEEGRAGKEAQEIADALAGSKSGQCENAEKWCIEGDEDACEFLQEECGLDELEIEQLQSGLEELDEDPAEVLGAGPDEPSVDLEPSAEPLIDLTPENSADEQTDGAEGELPGPALGALSKAWNAYRASRAEAEEAREQAEKWASVINGIRMVNGQPPMDFEALSDMDRQPIPDSDEETFPTEEGQITLEQACHGDRSSGIYDPCKDVGHTDD
jgi:hypothetical protein